MRTAGPRFTILLLLIMNSLNGFTQDYSANIFTSSGDIGNCGYKGNRVFLPSSQEYLISGSGENIWFENDQFFFTWVKLKGDFILRANVEFVGSGTHAHRKTGWMIRQSLDPGSPHISGSVHGDGLASLQFRREKGEMTDEKKSDVVAPSVIQLERKGDTFIFAAAQAGKPFDTITITDQTLTGEIYAGLFICSHDNEIREEAKYSNVRIIRPARDNFIPYRDYIGSNLEILDLKTGKSMVVYQHPGSIQAPNWSKDGKDLIYNCDGRLYRFDMGTGSHDEINSGFAVNNNNDHVLSFDGKMLGISNHVSEEDNKSIIFTIPVSGGTPKRITPLGPSYLHGWSPDGKNLIYTGERNGRFDIYKIAIKGKKEKRLTDSEGLDDGSEYTPDGRYIYFNSSRTGTMQIWRMKPDGSEQEQITSDEFNNWFPHISPDGQMIVFLSFPPEVKADDHPFYKHVYIRMMPVGGGIPVIIAYVYGGQGTINVPSWSPDSRKIAFVSNSILGLPH